MKVQRFEVSIGQQDKMIRRSFRKLRDVSDYLADCQGSVTIIDTKRDIELFADDVNRVKTVIDWFLEEINA